MQSEGGVCPYITGTVTRYCTLTPFTLTDEERLAIQWVVGEALSVDGVSIQETLRGLLERTAHKLAKSDN